MYSILIEPVIDVGLEINMISKVSRSGTGHEELRFFGYRMSATELFIGSIIIFADETESVS